MEEQIKKDPYAEIDAEFCGISKNHQLVQDFYRALKDKKVFGLFRIRYSIRDISPVEKRNALRAFGYVSFNGITLYNVTNDSDLIKRLKVLIIMIHLNNLYNHYEKMETEV